MAHHTVSENGLLLNEIKTNVTVVTFECVELNLEAITLQHFETEVAQAVFYLDYAVVFGRWSDKVWRFGDGDTQIPAEHLQLGRIFNRDKELKIWRGQQGLQARLRQDEEGVGSFIVEARQALWGTRTEVKGDWTVLTEDRGVELLVPISNLTYVEGEAKPLVYVRTRNYIDEHHETGQASYVDSRFVEIAKYDWTSLK